MPICNINTFLTCKTAKTRLLGLDVGRKTIGIAVSDVNRKVASPITIIQRRKFTPDMADLNTLADTHQAGGLVIGWPLNMDGSKGARCDSVRDFTHALLRLYDFPVLFQDERLSTASVERAMLEADMTRKKRAARRDALAATWILQSALDVMADWEYKKHYG